MDYFNLKTKLKSHLDFQHTSFIEKVNKVNFVLKSAQFRKVGKGNVCTTSK